VMIYDCINRRYTRIGHSLALQKVRLKHHGLRMIPRPQKDNLVDSKITTISSLFLFVHGFE
jgi:hypothetical protein